MYARFYCAAIGDPTPEILWQNAKQPNPNVFEIEKVNISHVGVYTCTARSNEKVSNAYAFLTVDDHFRKYTLFVFIALGRRSGFNRPFPL
jgi:hypothetical protein